MTAKNIRPFRKPDVMEPNDYQYMLILQRSMIQQMTALAMQVDAKDMLNFFREHASNKEAVTELEAMQAGFTMIRDKYRLEDKDVIGVGGEIKRNTQG